MDGQKNRLSKGSVLYQIFLRSFTLQGFSAEGVRYLLAQIRNETPQPGHARFYEFVDAGSCAPPQTKGPAL